MARCGCSGSCNCIITGTGVSGSGSNTDPYVIGQPPENALLKADNLADVPDKAAARNNLDLGTMATKNAADFAKLVNLARNPDLIIVGAITRNSNGAATSAAVVWPDGTPGTYTADTLSSAFPGAVDSYHVTYGSPVTMTFTQPAVTRDSTGAVTALPAIVVS